MEILEVKIMEESTTNVNAMQFYNGIYNGRLIKIRGFSNEWKNFVLQLKMDNEGQTYSN